MHRVILRQLLLPLWGLPFGFLVLVHVFLDAAMVFMFGLMVCFGKPISSCSSGGCPGPAWWLDRIQQGSRPSARDGALLRKLATGARGSRSLGVLGSHSWATEKVAQGAHGSGSSAVLARSFLAQSFRPTSLASHPPGSTCCRCPGHLKRYKLMPPDHRVAPSDLTRQQRLIGTQHLGCAVFHRAKKA